MSVETNVDEIISHMETDKLSIAPFVGNYIVAENSNEAKKLKRLPQEPEKLPSPHEHYFLVHGSDWQMVKNLRV